MAFLPGYGVLVVRPTEVLGNPAGASPSPRTIFTIAGGAVKVTLLVGRVTVLMDATPSTLRLQHSVNATFLCAALAAIADDAVETIYEISGDVADLMYKIEGAVAGAARGGLHGGIAAGAGVIANGMDMLPGTIQELWTGDQDGSIQWTLCYLPITQGATVVAT
jgi:hypothetical protein